MIRQQPLLGHFPPLTLSEAMPPNGRLFFGKYGAQLLSPAHAAWRVAGESNFYFPISNTVYEQRDRQRARRSFSITKSYDDEFVDASII